jgi:hypothetical protein
MERRSNSLPQTWAENLQNENPFRGARGIENLLLRTDLSLNEQEDKTQKALSIIWEITRMPKEGGSIKLTVPSARIIQEGKWRVKEGDFYEAEFFNSGPQEAKIEIKYPRRRQYNSETEKWGEITILCDESMVEILTLTQEEGQIEIKMKLTSSPDSHVHFIFEESEKIPEDLKEKSGLPLSIPPQQPQKFPIREVVPEDINLILKICYLALNPENS